MAANAMQVEEGDIQSINSTLVGSIILVEGTGLSLLRKVEEPG